MADRVRPDAASCDTRNGEFMLPYDAVRTARNPDAALMELLKSTYERGATLAGWNCSALEPGRLPERHPRSAWSPAASDPADARPSTDAYPTTGRRRRNEASPRA